jgi:hypothetical protein
MEPLDLTVAPPRLPRETVAGVVFLARSIDKARASLPGGNIGAYQLAFATTWMLDAFGKTVEGFVAAVAAAKSDDDVAAWLLAETAPNAVAEWNAHILQRKPRDGTREAALAVFPWLAEYPDMTLVVDILVEDDRRHFASA